MTFIKDAGEQAAIERVRDEARGEPRMNVELLTTLEQVERIAPEWRQFDTSGLIPLPFATADWTLAWWRHLRSNRMAVRDHVFTLAVRDPSRTLVGVAPLMLTERPAIGPLRLRCLQFIGADNNLTEVRTLSTRPGHEVAVYRAVAKYVRAADNQWHWMLWTGIRQAGNEVPAQIGKGRWVRCDSDWVLPLGQTWEQFQAGLHRNVKESLRKCRNAPRRAGLDFRLEVATRSEHMGPALDRFFELHAARAHSTNTVYHGNVFKTAAARNFLRELCARYAAREITHIFNLKLRERTIATRLGFKLGGSMYLYFSGYDPAYGRYSAMTSCLAGAIRWSIEAGLQTVNLSTGTDVSKTRWGPEEHVFGEAHLVSPSLIAHAAHLAHSLVDRRVTSEWARRLVGRRAST
jgi:CelD/BcsL family acetyltransferase involved in cellulose biosynthesis